MVPVSLYRLQSAVLYRHTYVQISDCTVHTFVVHLVKVKAHPPDGGLEVGRGILQVESNA